MKRKLIVAMLTTAMVASLAGCGSSSASTSADTKDSAESTEAADDTAEESGDTAAAGTGKIGISMPTQSLERWNRDGAYLDEQFKQAGFETVLTYSDNDSGKQVNDSRTCWLMM